MLYMDSSSTRMRFAPGKLQTRTNRTNGVRMLIKARSLYSSAMQYRIVYLHHSLHTFHAGYHLISFHTSSVPVRRIHKRIKVRMQNSRTRNRIGCFPIPIRENVQTHKRGGGGKNKKLPEKRTQDGGSDRRLGCSKRKVE